MDNPEKLAIFGTQHAKTGNLIKNSETFFEV
jgi:hypothetical protein